MIAKLESKAFTKDTLSRKVEYHQSKIDDGKAKLLFSSLHSENLSVFKRDCLKISTLNDRVKLPFNEVSLNFPKGEKMNDVSLLDIAHEYMQMLGYAESCYSIIRHDDKDHNHIHILFTTINLSGCKINDSYLRLRSQKISRELEKKYNLKETIYNKFENKNLNEIKSREFYFDRALRKGLKNEGIKQEIEPLLVDTFYYDIDSSKNRSTEFYQAVFGDKYQEIGDILQKHNLFKASYKQELLVLMNDAYDKAGSIREFVEVLKNNGGYIRQVTDKGVSSYVYGLSNASIYFKEKSFPEKFRFKGLRYLSKNQPAANLLDQKRLVYNIAFVCLHKANDYSEFVNFMRKNNIEVIESSNSRGVYGLSFGFIAENGNDTRIYKASEVSRRLSYHAIQEYFDNKNNTPEKKNTINKIVDNNEIINEMRQVVQIFYSSNNSLQYYDDENNLLKRKPKNIKKGL